MPLHEVRDAHSSYAPALVQLNKRAPSATPFGNTVAREARAYRDGHNVYGTALVREDPGECQITCRCDLNYVVSGDVPWDDFRQHALYPVCKKLMSLPNTGPAQVLDITLPKSADQVPVSQDQWNVPQSPGAPLKSM